MTGVVVEQSSNARQLVGDLAPGQGDAVLGTLCVDLEGKHLLTRKSSVELDRWRNREETMRMLRWAPELGTDAEEDRARAGLHVLAALLDSPLLDDDDVDLVATIATYVAEGPRGEEAPALPPGS